VSPLRVAVAPPVVSFVYGASAPLLFGVPLCTSGFMCGYLFIGYLDSYVNHGYPTHGILDHGYSPFSSATSTSVQRAIIRTRLRQFFSGHSIRTAPTLCLRGDVIPLVSIFGFFSSLTVCSAPVVTAGGY